MVEYLLPPKEKKATNFKVKGSVAMKIDEFLEILFRVSAILVSAYLFLFFMGLIFPAAAGVGGLIFESNKNPVTAFIGFAIGIAGFLFALFVAVRVASATFTRLNKPGSVTERFLCSAVLFVVTIIMIAVGALPAVIFLFATLTLVMVGGAIAALAGAS